MSLNLATVEKDLITRGTRFELRRARRSDGMRVVLKSARSVDDRSVKLLEHEYALLEELGPIGVTRPLALTTIHGKRTLVVEDAGPRSLATVEGHPLGIAEFLDLAAQMTQIVGAVHAKRVIHRDLCPANFVLGEEAGRVTLVDFEAATPVPAFAQSPGLPRELQGTLAYMAPEQTGRMNRVVDHRADLYALGATFYEMLTGEPPFATRDPLELVHAHVARRPESPSAVRSAVPQQISAIVLKLLSKMPEWRYQTAGALETDLAEARRQFRLRDEIDRFELGRVDVPYGLFLRGRLYGRDPEKRELEQAVERVVGGAAEAMFLVGPAGIGKSALMEELRAKAERECRWLVGRCDQLRGNIPHAPISDALRGLVRGLDREPREIVDRLRDAITRAVTPNGRVLTEAIPELERLIADQPPLADVGPVEVENRFHLVFWTFVRALVDSGRPLVLFLDDLQWSDQASLNLLRSSALYGDTRSVLILGAYRSEEVGPDHPVARALASIRQTGMRVRSLPIGPLGSDSLVALLCEALPLGRPEASPLAASVRRKTGGNPFFVRRFLAYLHQAGLLSSDPATGTWTFDLPRIDAAAVTTNVVDLLTTVLRTLPGPTQEALKIAACIGRKFELDLLAGVSGEAAQDLPKALWLPLEQGLIVPTVGEPRRDWSARRPVELDTAVAPAYRFVHDRIQQAAYELFSDEERKRTHLTIGRWLQANADGYGIGPIVDQLNRAAELLSEGERVRLAELDLRAGVQSRSSSAYDSALGYFRIGLGLLPEGACRRRDDLHDLWFRLERGAAECASLIGAHALCDELIEEGLAHSAEVLEKVAFYNISLQTKALRGEYVEAVLRGLGGLALLGLPFPSQVTAEDVAAEKLRVRSILAARSERELLDAPPLADPLVRERLRLLLNTSSAWYAAVEHFKLFAFRAAELTAVHGMAPESPTAYGCYAVALALEGDYEEAYTYGRLAAHLAERLGNPVQQCRALMLYGGHVNAWRAPIRESLPILRCSAALGIESGEFEFASYALGNVPLALLVGGADLGQLRAEAESVLAYYQRIQNPIGTPYMVSLLQLIKCLKGLTRGRDSFDDEDFEESAFLKGTAENALGNAIYYVTRVIACSIHGEPAAAWAYAKRAVPWLSSLRTLLLQVTYYFHAALSLCSLAAKTAPDARGELLAELHDALRRLDKWASNAPANFAHKRDLVRAELAWIEGRPTAAVGLYERAIEGAAREGFQQDEAIAHERCGRFHAARAAPTMAALHLAAAVDRYARWGATAQVERLREEFPALEAGADRGALAATAVLPELDYLSLLRAAETLSEELMLDRLIAKMTRICAEAAAAERAVLLLNEGELVCRASATATREMVLERRPLAATRSIPRSVIEHVVRAREPLLLSDAARDPRFRSDPVVAERGLRSVLVVPMVRSERVVGMLYFENNLSSDAFPPARAEMIRLLSAQMAIAVENSRLFEARARAEGALRLLADASARLAESLDYEAVIAKVASVAVPRLADFCAVDISSEDGTWQPAAWAHADPSLAPLVQAMHRRYSVAGGATGGSPLAEAARSAKPILFSELTDEFLADAFPDEETSRLVRSLNVRSVMTVPLIAEGRSLGIVTLASTDPLKRFDAADLALAEELVRRAALAIDGAQLYRKAKDAVRARDEFLLIAAHEIRGPITSLQLAAQTLAGHMFAPSETRKLLQLIERQGRRLSQFVEDLLELGRSRAGKLDFDYREVDLGDVIRDVVSRLGLEFVRSGSVLSTAVEGAVVGQWDRSRIDQVVTNLLGNAIKFGSGNPIEVSAQARDGRATLIVRDHGIGIAQGSRERLFEPFVRGVPVRNYGGLGLGLNIVKRIVEGMGGSVAVESELGKGAAFVVQLPQARGVE